MKRDFLKMLLIAILPICAVSCVDNIPEEEVLPRDAVSFEYYIDQKTDSVYYLDYYIDSYITFVNTSPETTKGAITWNFGENAVFNSEDQGKDIITCYYTKAGTYTVKLTIGDFSKQQVVMIAPIKPIVGIKMSDDICEVRNTLVDFNVELPNPQNKPATFLWTFPEDTKNENGEEVLTYESSSPEDAPKGLQFSHVGSQQVKLTVKLGGIELEDATLNVQVGYNKEVPTLYYAVPGGRLMAYKLTGEDNDSTMKINPLDLGVAAGQHPFTLLFEDSLLYVLDAGKQFYYVNDVNGVLGDGKISVIAKDGSKVQTMISNAGQAAFDDPFHGMIEGDYLYYANRNTGIIKLPLKDRDKLYSSSEYPYYVQHQRLNYYGNGLVYGACSGVFSKINGVWHWGLYHTTTGVYCFTDDDILPSTVTTGDKTKLPEEGVICEGMKVKSHVYTSKSATPKVCFCVMEMDANNFYVCTYDEWKAIGTSKTKLASYVKTYNGMSFASNLDNNLPTMEGTGVESVGICQMAYDEVNDCVYFAYRNNGKNPALYPPTGIYCYSVKDDAVTCLIEGVTAYGLVVNNTPSKLF